MQSTKNDLEMRKAEVEEVLKFLQYFETDFSIPSDADFSVLGVKTSIKANIVLMLYNAVESTVTSCLKKIHERIRNDSLKYRDLSDQLKKIMAVYYGHSMEKASNMDDEMVIALRFADFVNNLGVFDVSYDELSNKYQLYSGNLDSKEINNVLKKYGIPFNEKCSELQTIKRDRNILAHGEMSFEEIGRDLSIPQLKEMSNRTFNFLNKMIDSVSFFLVNEGYKCSTVATISTE